MFPNFHFPDTSPKKKRSDHIYCQHETFQDIKQVELKDKVVLEMAIKLQKL